MPHFCVVAAFYMLLQKSSLFLCHIFCCGSLPCTFVAPEQEIESNLCYYDFQPFKHPSLQLLIFIHSTQLGHIKSSAVGLGHSFSLYHLKVLKTPRPSASDFHSRATPHSQAILMPPPPGWGNNVKYTSLALLKKRFKSSSFLFYFLQVNMFIIKIQILFFVLNHEQYQDFLEKDATCRKKRLRKQKEITPYNSLKSTLKFFHYIALIKTNFTVTFFQ